VEEIMDIKDEGAPLQPPPPPPPPLQSDSPSSSVPHKIYSRPTVPFDSLLNSVFATAATFLGAALKV